DLSRWCEERSRDTTEALNWLQYAQLGQELDKELGHGALATLRQGTDEAEKIPSIIRRRILLDWLDAWYTKEPGLLRFATRDHIDTINSFSELDKFQFPVAARDEVRKRVYCQYPKSSDLNMLVLRQEISKQRRRMPIRKLFEKVPHLV